VQNRPPSFLFLSVSIGLGILLALLGNAAAKLRAEDKPAATKPRDAILRTPEQAVLEATFLQDAMHAMLQITHHRYYKEDEGLELPAATMAEVFKDLEEEHQLKLRWLVVEGQAMNSDHLAQDDFERAAVQSLLAGKKVHESLENGYYRRAGAITLSNVCLKCHVPDRRDTRNRTAGLVISIPVRQ